MVKYINDKMLASIAGGLDPAPIDSGGVPLEPPIYDMGVNGKTGFIVQNEHVIVYRDLFTGDVKVTRPSQVILL